MVVLTEQIEIPASYDSILDKISVFISKVPALENWLVTTLEIDLEHPRDIEWTKFFTKVVELIIGSKDGQLNSIMDSTVNIVSGIGSGIVSFCIALVFGIYVLAYKEKLSYQVHKLIRSYLKPKAENIIYYICHVASETFSNFIVGQCTEAVILGTLCIIGMSIFRFPYAVMIGTLVGATALIPIIGAYVGAIVGAIIVLTGRRPVRPATGGFRLGHVEDVFIEGNRYRCAPGLNVLPKVESADAARGVVVRGNVLTRTAE